MLELVLFDGSDRRFPLQDGKELMVGVEATCAIHLRSVDVSRAHALITCQKGRIVLLDLGSTNGTFVNGKRVKETELRVGDTVRFSSVMAQLMPSSAAATSDDSSSGPKLAWDHSSSGGNLRVTSEWQPAALHEVVSSLLERWVDGTTAALGALTDWLVTRRGYRAAAVLEGVGGEVVVLSAHGDVTKVLDDPECGSLVRRAPHSGPAPQTVQTTIANQRIVAVQMGRSPWLLLATGRSTPDNAELVFLLRLLQVATRLEAAGPTPR